jgi:transcriptional regulator with XRE-family HTH domain
MIAPESPGDMLRSLRLARRLTQEQLAARAEVSTRHLSFLEGGRAHPSHAMILDLCSALDLSLRERNTLLVAAGFAPKYYASPRDAQSMRYVQQAVARLLQVHDPHPAMLLDREWNILELNSGALRFLHWLGLGLMPTAGSLNAYRIVFDPAFGLRQLISNFDQVADAALARLRAESETNPEMRDLYLTCKTMRGPVRTTVRQAESLAVALPLHIRHRGEELRYFTTLTSLGTPLDVTAQELCIEGYFPLDAATEAFAQRLEREASSQ